jgi:hypothetical protein
MLRPDGYDDSAGKHVQWVHDAKVISAPIATVHRTKKSPRWGRGLKRCSLRSWIKPRRSTVKTP